MEKKRHAFLRVFIIVIFCFAAIFAYFYLTSKKLTVTSYEVKAPITSSIRIVQLTDLHNTEFGENNSDLVELVKAQSPDLIVMTGDMINRDDENLEIVIELVSNITAIAPVYYGHGNHEYEWEANWGSDLRKELSDAGAIVLDNEFIDININDNQLRLAGYMGYYWQPHMMTKDKEQQEVERRFYGEFQDTDRYKILLNHIPTQWLDWNYIDTCNVDLVFSGHYHGGLIRIPLLDRGLYAPYVGWFPPYTKGVYTGIETTCILSAGLGSEYNIPRLNNPPEIIVTDLIPEQDSPATE